jgi:uncharacterized membrane protein YtjA (UPF0391 family)
LSSGGDYIENGWDDAHLSLALFLLYFAEGGAMLYYALVFLIVGLIAGALGVSGVASVASQIAWVLFVIAIVLFIVHFISGRRRVI